MRRKTSSPSASCGIDRGETNAVASITERPEAESASTNATFTSAGTTAASFWRPSRGPTSTTVTKPALM